MRMNLLFGVVVLLIIAVGNAVKLPLKNVILFDGECNFCNGWVDLIEKFDPERKIKFSAIQSSKGSEIMKLIGKDSEDLSTVVYVRYFSPGDEEIEKITNPTNEVFFKSGAIVHVFEDLFLPRWIANFILLITPEFVRDKMYDLVAKNRYKIMGKRDECSSRGVSDDEL
jgi:predicted DCC family thiol-disulfide oxidoreductase YuxK